MKRQAAGEDPLAGERGTHRRKWAGQVPLALIFPNRYGLGNSNLGFQLVYDLVNRLPGLVCERFFYEAGRRVLSSESGRPLRDFPILLCAFSFEQDFQNFLALLLAGGIEPLAAKRAAGGRSFGPGRPLLIGGGVATFINPEPLAPFIDLFVIGESESLLPELLPYIVENWAEQSPDALLAELAKNLVGCYVPSLYRFTYRADGILEQILAQDGAPARVRRRAESQPAVAGHSKLLSPKAEFADLYLTELGRGCSRGCRFCAAGFVYRPPRLWQVESILAALKQRPEGIDRVGLLGMEMAKTEDLAQIAEQLLGQGCALSFSSLRADAIGPELCRLLSKSGLKTAAIAPDGGSERLRKVINKGISEEDVLAAASALVEAGLRHLKLYFMIGLPSETDEDMVELLSLAGKVREILLAIGRSRGRLSHLTLSVNSFVPKAWTPFQFHPFAPLPVLKKRIVQLKKGVAALANTSIQVDQPANALFQAVLARGDRRVGMALLDGLIEGKNWRQSLADAGLTAADYAQRQRGQHELFPWEIIDQGIRRHYLWAEYRRAMAAKTTPACKPASCRRCGVCNDL